MKRLIKEYGKDKNNRDKMAAAAKRAVNRGDDRTYHNSISSLLKAGCSKEEMEDFQDKFEKNESKNMNKQVKLSESDFHDVVRGAVENILKEYTNFDKEKMYGKPSYNKEDVEDDDELNAQPTNNLATNEGKQYKVNEQQLHQIIKESVMRILNEIGDTHPSGEGNYALALDAADKATRLGRHQQAANLRSHASRYFNDRFGTEEFGMDDNGKVGYEEPDFWADYTPYPELDKESDGITDYATQAERNDAANALKKKYHNNSEIERRASVARAYPRKRMTGGITSYNNFNNYMKNR